MSADFKAEKAERLQQLGMVVHGLRNPASGILTAAEYLMEDSADALNEEQKTLLRGVAQASMLILRTVENILEFSRFECGKLTANIIRSDLISLARDVILLNQPQARRKNINIQTQFKRSTLIVDLDPNKITQVIDNLFSNAIKFSDPGTMIHVNCGMDGGLAWISIRDEGIGIQPERLEKIFVPFQRPECEQEFQRAGAGLGLAISRQIVELHGGTIAVNSTVGQGSEFKIHLPVRAAVEKSADCFQGRRFETASG
jgi:signal transduction histidine kinase